MKENINTYTDAFKALGDDTRLKILTMLTHGKTCACKILEKFNFAQPTLSYHMKQLTDSRLVLAEKDSKWVYYSINEDMIENLCKLLHNINQVGNTFCGCCND